MRIKHLILIISLILIAQSVFSDPFFIRGKLYTSTGVTGTASTENSFASVTIFRDGISGQIGHQYNGPDPLYPNKIYPAGYQYVTVPAYCYTDVGSYYWSTSPASSQVVRAVFEVANNVNGWSGATYLAFSSATISDDDLIDRTLDLADTQLILLPAPAISSFDMSQVSISWTGVNSSWITGYKVYRTNITDNITQSVATFVTQTAGALITFTDTTVVTGKTYSYSISAWYIDGTSQVYETSVKSLPSSSVLIPLPTSTATPTITSTVTRTVTPTLTATRTITPTCTVTPTPLYTDNTFPTGLTDWVDLGTMFLTGPFFNGFTEVSINTDPAYIISGTKSIKISTHFCCGDWIWASKYGVLAKNFSSPVDLSNRTVFVTLLTKNIQSNTSAGLWAFMEFIPASGKSIKSPRVLFDDNVTLSYTLPSTGASNITRIKFYIGKDFSKGGVFTGTIYLTDFKWY